jgi:hypothetical protein
MVLRCTAKALRLLGLAAGSFAQRAPSDDDWYLNLLWFDGRKCVLLTHAGTLFSVLVVDVRKADVTPVGRFVARSITRELRAEGLPIDTFGLIDPNDVGVATTASRSVLGCMNDSALQCEYAIRDAGGLAHVDVDALNHLLRRNIHSVTGYARPIDLARRR